MRNLTRFPRLAAALFALGAGVAAAQGPAETKADAKSAAATAAKDAVQKSRPAGSLSDLMRELAATRETLIKDHDALAKKLKDATDEEKKAIKEKMEEQMKAFQAQQAALHKQIRDEQRRQRQAPKR